MSKLKGILLLLIAAILMGCATQPQQPKEEKPVVKQQPVKTAPAEEKPAEPEKAPEPQQSEKNNTGNETTVYFAPKMYRIDTFTAHKLDSIAELLKAKDVTQIKIIGHCAKLDSTKEEERLSLQRALAVARYFEGTGAFKAGNMTISAEGAEHPAGSHTEISERKHNRRVEIYY
ncbi:OmpA family protein [Treponema sp. OMZ 305]|uniref:OmpA family protein n=1 Tax=unclassified Treponema TaxID=2638727 RepID=UPI0020A3D3DB|nr:OmpA family protein [Treponema sp. OMZ 305]UTC57317.1 OmpA family protein [Treponema sp. OMZ 305]